MEPLEPLWIRHCTVPKLSLKNVYSSHEEMTTAFQLDFQLILAGKDH